MDLYNWKLKLSETEFFNNSLEKQNYLKDCLKNATQYYEANKSRIEPYAIKTIQLGNKEPGFKTINLDSPPRPKITHKQAFENKYNEFIKEIKSQIIKLNEYVEVENEILKCEQRTSTQEKFFCYTKLNKTYLDHLRNSELLLKKANPKAYTEDVNLYTPFIQKIESRLSELKQTNHKAPVKQNTKTKPITLSPNFDDFNGQTKEIHNLTTSLFVASLEQWQNLFSNDIQVFKVPIELKNNTTISDLRLFLDTLYNKGLIKKQRFNKVLENVKAFSYEGKVLEAEQYKNAKQIENYPHTKNYIKVSEIFTALNLDD